MRRKIVAGNWKMNMNLQEGLSLAKAVDNFMQKNESGVEVILCTPFIHLAHITTLFKADNIYAGAQNCSNMDSGAYTGEISAKMIKSTGAQYVIIGHSERRSYYNENDELLNEKIIIALNNDLKVIFCCGEVLSEREKGEYYEVVKAQIEKAFSGISLSDFRNIIIAYEPVWAIGTGVTASSAQAQEMHFFIRSVIEKMYGKEQSDKTVILYGGSCKPSNSSELFSMNDVDGGLIGGASLKEDDFCKIIESFKGK
ncbi:MAG TPA: triose-phosphate isomerase [Bacteroidales bacterium]|nr:triose-phosphate isomerase [Bacteroidales bacterium]